MKRLLVRHTQTPVLRRSLVTTGRCSATRCVASMSDRGNFTLHYFDGHGRGEKLRMLLELAEQKFEDKRYAFPNGIAPLKNTLLPFGQVPCLEHDGAVVCETPVIGSYLGKVLGLYPEDVKDQAKADMISAVLKHWQTVTLLDKMRLVSSAALGLLAFLRCRSVTILPMPCSILCFCQLSLLQ